MSKRALLSIKVVSFTFESTPRCAVEFLNIFNRRKNRGGVMHLTALIECGIVQVALWSRQGFDPNLLQKPRLKRMLVV